MADINVIVPPTLIFLWAQEELQRRTGHQRTTYMGGIDLTPASMNLQTQNNSDVIKFHIDPVMLKQLQKATGFIPVIINIQPLNNLKQFLGVDGAGSL